MASALANGMMAILTAAALVLSSSCSSRRAADGADGGGEARFTTGRADERPAVSALPRAVIYKTAGDYYDNVPVGMDAAGRHVASYPAPSDLLVGGRLTKPVRLDGGYLLDRRGVTEHSAFLDYTYEEYAALAVPPTAGELERHVVARRPFTEMYFAEWRGDDAIDYYNSIVASGFEGCERADLDTVPAMVRLKVRE